MSRETFNKLCQYLEKLRKKNTIFRCAIPYEQRIAIALYALGSSAEYRSVGNLFGVSKSIVCKILIEFSKEVYSQLKTPYLNKLPMTKDNIEECVEDFEMLGLPQCLGAIDGCHIEIHPTCGDAIDYYNYKGWYSTVLPALVDYRYSFLYINVGSPVRCNDSQIYEKSLLKRSLAESQLLVDNSKNICGVEVPVYIIGDSAFRFSKSFIICKEKRSVTFYQRQDELWRMHLAI